MDDKKKISIIGGSAVLLVAVVAAVAVVSLNHKPNNGNADGSVPTSVKAIKNFCQPTEYKETCEDTLTNIAGEKTDIKSLVLGSIRPIVEHLKDAVKHSSVLLEAEKDPQAAVVLKACSVYFDYAMQDLEEGISKIEGYELKDMWQAAYDIQDYLSAATQYQLDCLDDFKNATSDAAIGMKNALSTSAMLTHNGLIIVNKFVSAAESDNFHSSLGGGNNTNVERKPTDVEGIPSWVSSKQRMVLQTTNPWDLKPFAVVAKDGSGNFTSVIKALNSIPIKSKNYTVIYVKEGVYDELVVIKKNMHNVVMVGDGKTKSKITGKLSVGFDNVTTTNSATFKSSGMDYRALMAKAKAAREQEAKKKKRPSTGPQGGRAPKIPSVPKTADMPVVVLPDADPEQDEVEASDLPVSDAPTPTAKTDAPGSSSGTCNVRAALSLQVPPLTAEAEKILTEEHKRIFIPDWQVMKVDGFLGDGNICMQAVKHLPTPKDRAALKSRVVGDATMHIARNTMSTLCHFNFLLEEFASKEQELSALCDRERSERAKAVKLFEAEQLLSAKRGAEVAGLEAKLAEAMQRSADEAAKLEASEKENAALKEELAEARSEAEKARKETERIRAKHQLKVAKVKRAVQQEAEQHMFKNMEDAYGRALLHIAARNPGFDTSSYHFYDPVEGEEELPSAMLGPEGQADGVEGTGETEAEGKEEDDSEDEDVNEDMGIVGGSEDPSDKKR